MRGIEVRLYLQGISRDLEPNGSFEVLDVGTVSLDQVVGLIRSLPREYPQDVLSMDEYCPMNVIIETEYASMSIAILEDGTYFIMFSDNVSGWEYELYEKSRDRVIAAIKRYIGREQIEAPKLKRPRYSIPVKLWSSDLGEYLTIYLVLDMDEKTFASIPLHNIAKIELKRRSLFSGAKIEIVYVDEEGRSRRARYELLNEKDIEKHYNALASTVGVGRVKIR